MKGRILTGALVVATVLLSSSFAFAAESGGGSTGSWIKFGLYVINFAIFMIIVFYYAGPSTSEYLSEGARVIRSDFEQLQAGLKEAQELADRAGARMAGIEGEIKSLVEGIDQEMVFRAGKIRESGRVGAERTRRDAELTAKALSEEARRRVRERVAANASRMALELVQQRFEPGDQQRLVDGFMDRLSSEAAR